MLFFTVIRNKIFFGQSPKIIQRAEAVLLWLLPFVLHVNMMLLAHKHFRTSTYKVRVS